MKVYEINARYRLIKCMLSISLHQITSVHRNVNFYKIICTKITAAQNDIAFSYHRVYAVRAIFSGSYFYGFFRQNFLWMLKRTEIDGFTFRLLDQITKWKILEHCECFIAVFLSHGENEALSCVDGSEVSWDLGG